MYFDPISKTIDHADIYPLVHPFYHLLAYRNYSFDSLSFCLAAFTSVQIIGICGGVEFRFGQEYLHAPISACWYQIKKSVFLGE
jgi:hypothetical protein